MSVAGGRRAETGHQIFGEIGPGVAVDRSPRNQIESHDPIRGER